MDDSEGPLTTPGLRAFLRRRGAGLSPQNLVALRHLADLGDRSPEAWEAIARALGDTSEAPRADDGWNGTR